MGFLTFRYLLRRCLEGRGHRLAITQHWAAPRPVAKPSPCSDPKNQSRPELSRLQQVELQRNAKGRDVGFGPSTESASCFLSLLVNDFAQRDHQLDAGEGISGWRADHESLSSVGKVRAGCRTGVIAFVNVTTINHNALINVSSHQILTIFFRRSVSE